MYNPLAGILFRLLGQAAASEFSKQAQGGTGGAQNTADPFGDMFGGMGAQQDDSPIDVDAEVIDEDGTSQTRKAYDAQEAKRKTAAAHQLSGAVVFEGSKKYNISVAIISFVLLLAGAALRLYSLVMGNIFSSVVVPVALGAIAGFILAVIGVVLIWRKGASSMPFAGIDLLLVFVSAAAMGYANLVPTAISLAICFAYLKSTGFKKIPFFIPYLIVAVVIYIAFGFPGLYPLFG